MGGPGYDQSDAAVDPGIPPGEWLMDLARAVADAGGRTAPVDSGDATPGLLGSMPTLPASAGLSGVEVFGEPFEPDPEGGLGRLGDFRLIGEVGRGGMGVVYEAVQVSLNRRVALKVLPFASALDSRQLARFQLEAQAAASLHHNHIVPVFSTGNERGVWYYAMQFIEGWDLSQVIRRSRGGPSGPGSGFHARAAAGLGHQAAEALEFAHRNDVLHRDVKPSNLLIDGQGKLWITDFGLARVRGDLDLTATGEAPGTLRYMSPEQALGRRGQVDGRSDLYALGATLYEFLTGRPAFTGADRLDLLRRIATEPPTPPRRLNPAVPADLETVVLKAMAKDPADRYATAGEMAADLARFLDDRPVLARRVTAAGRAVRWARRHPRLAARAAALSALAAVAVAGVSWHTNAWLVGQNAALNRAVGLANTHAVQLEGERRRAVEAVRRADRHLYAADLRLACQAVDSGHFERAQDILRDALAIEGRPTRRGFVWHYLWGEASRVVASMPATESKAGSIAVSPDGRTLAQTDLEGALLLRGLDGARADLRLTASDLFHDRVVFAPDGRHLAALEADSRDGPTRRVVIWDAVTGRRVARLNPERGESAFRFAFLAGGRVLGVDAAAPDQSRSLQLWRLADGGGEPTRPVVRLRGLLNVGLTEGSAAVLANHNDRVAVHDALTGEVQSSVSGDFHRVSSWGVSSDGAEVAGAVWDRGVVRWDARTGACLGATPVGTPVVSLAYAPGGRAVAAVDSTGTVHLLDPDQARSFDLRPDGLTRRRFVVLAFSPDGTRLVTSGFGSPGGQQPVTVWDVATGRPLARFPGRPDQVSELAFAPDGRSVFLGGGGTVRRWRIEPSAQVKEPDPAGHSDEAWSLAFSPDGRTLASGSDEDGEPVSLKLFDAETGRLLAGWRPHDPGTVGALAYSPDGRLLASGAFDPSNNLRLWDARSGELLATLDGHNGHVRSVAFSPDGRLLASGGDEGSGGIVRLWDVAGRRPLRAPTGHQGKVRSLAFAPDSKTLASAGNDREVRLWDASTGACVRSLRVGEKVGAVAFSPTGNCLAAADESGQLTFWDPSSGDRTKVIRAEGGELRCLAFSPDGLVLAAAGESRVIRAFDVETGQEVLAVKAHADQINAVAFAPDGRLLASCAHDGSVRYWRAAPDPFSASPAGESSDAWPVPRDLGRR